VLAVTSTTGGGRSVDIVLLRNQATEFFYLYMSKELVFAPEHTKNANVCYYYYLFSFETNARSMQIKNCFILFFLIPFYLQAVQIHSANGGKLREACVYFVWLFIRSDLLYEMLCFNRTNHN
jgi:hypothetical protein